VRSPVVAQGDRTGNDHDRVNGESAACMTNQAGSSSRRQGAVTVDTASTIFVVHSFPTWLPQTRPGCTTQVAEQQRLGVSLSWSARKRRTSTVSVATSRTVQCRRLVETLGQRVAQTRHPAAPGVSGESLSRGQCSVVAFPFRQCRLVESRRRAASRPPRHVVTFYGLDVSLLPTRFPVWRSRLPRAVRRGGPFSV